MDPFPDSRFDPVLVDRLNRLSVTRSFTPQIDVDWTAVTTDAEYQSLYSSWSLLVGTGADASFDAGARVAYAKYQQMNLMLFPARLERHAMGALARMFDLDPAAEFSEYLGHFMKEELYHTMMFARAIRQIQESMPGMPGLPSWPLDRALRVLFGLAGALPHTRMRCSLVFTILRFAEQVSIYANQTVQSEIPRRESLVNQVWGFHALDETRHLAFDAMILERNRVAWPLSWAPAIAAAPWCVFLSLLLNANEIWAARRLGAAVSLLDLPRLMRRTRAPFKRRVFGLVWRVVRGGDVSGT